MAYYLPDDNWMPVRVSRDEWSRFREETGNINEHGIQEPGWIKKTVCYIDSPKFRYDVLFFGKPGTIYEVVKTRKSVPLWGNPHGDLVFLNEPERHETLESAIKHITELHFQDYPYRGFLNEVLEDQPEVVHCPCEVAYKKQDYPEKELQSQEKETCKQTE